MVQSDSVRSKAGQQGRMRDEKPIWRADDRLSQTTQTAWERSRNNIRSQQVHDRNLQFGVCLDGSLPVFERKPGPFHYYPIGKPIKLSNSMEKVSRIGSILDVEMD